VSAGAVPSDTEALGILDEDRNKIFVDAILAIWEDEPPYDIDLHTYHSSPITPS